MLITAFKTVYTDRVQCSLQKNSSAMHLTLSQYIFYIHIHKLKHCDSIRNIHLRNYMLVMDLALKA